MCEDGHPDGSSGHMPCRCPPADLASYYVAGIRAGGFDSFESGVWDDRKLSNMLILLFDIFLL